MEQPPQNNEANTPLQKLNMEAQIVEALRTCYDPEIPVNIYDLGLIYGLEIKPDNTVVVRMTMTAPHCPVAQSLPIDVQLVVKSIPEVKDVKVDVVWDPPWDQSRMSEEAKLQLGMI